MSTIIRPMLAAHMEEARTRVHLQEDGFLFAQPKIDGFRYLFDDGTARSRSWKAWKHRAVQAFAKDHADLIHGWDGEGTPGHDFDPEGFRIAMSELRAETGSDVFTLWLFDNFDVSWAHYPYLARYGAIVHDLFTGKEEEVWDEQYLFDTFDTPERFFQGPGYHVKVKLCPTFVVRSMEEIEELYQLFLKMGFEGIILRRKGRGYKWNRSTAKEGSLIKRRPEDPFEAVITGVYAREKNTNEAKISALGYTVRSAHKAGKVEQEMVGGFNCHLLGRPDIEFDVGVLRLDDGQKERLWKIRDQLPGEIIECVSHGYKGGYDKPRTPVMVRFRDKTEF